MANLTITVDDETLKRARIRAVERGQSVNSYLAEQLRVYADQDTEMVRQQRVVSRLLQLSDSLAGHSGETRWSREDLYDERRTR